MSMTENEAIDVILKDHSTFKNPMSKAYVMACKALEEVQAYRTIGTVEEIEKSMRNVSVLLAEHELLKLYQSIGTIDEFKALKEKNEPKKPNAIDEKMEENFYYLAFTCPTCGSGVIGQPYRPNNCKHCGQKLDWQ